MINGSGNFISRAGHADFAIVFAVTDGYEAQRPQAQRGDRLPGGQGHARDDRAHSGLRA
ncbi:hypothetical protein ACPA9J_05385 [Pseudomonas aeruginosa]